MIWIVCLGFFTLGAYLIQHNNKRDGLVALGVILVLLGIMLTFGALGGLGD